MQYIKRLYNIWGKLRWLKRIDREMDRYNRLKHKMNRQQYVIKQLADGYYEAYGEKLFKGGNA
jgi:hypothetical protein